MLLQRLRVSGKACLPARGCYPAGSICVRGESRRNGFPAFSASPRLRAAGAHRERDRRRRERAVRGQRGCRASRVQPDVGEALLHGMLRGNGWLSSVHGSAAGRAARRGNGTAQGPDGPDTCLHRSAPRSGAHRPRQEGNGRAGGLHAGSGWRSVDVAMTGKALPMKLLPYRSSDYASRMRRASRRILFQALAVVCAFAASHDLRAQGPAKGYPVKPVRIIISLPPAGTTDIVARIVAQKLTEALGQTVIVDNRPGGGTTIGNAVAARAAPDGYTLLYSGSSLATTVPLYRNLPYDPIRDFVPIGPVGQSFFVLAVHPSLPVHSVRELID